MSISFAFFFDTFFLMNLVEAIFFVLTYTMLFLSSKKQKEEIRLVKLLNITSLISIIISVIPLIRPVVVCINCSSDELLIAHSYAFTIEFISIIPILLCLGISFLQIGKANSERYGKILFTSGILWLITFIGYLMAHIALIFGETFPYLFLYIMSIFGFLTTLSIPAIILMIIHGAKFKDKYFILAGVFYLLSYSSIFMAWLPLPSPI